MTFPHGDSAFRDLLRIVARDSGLAVALVEKDYWVTHTLWGLREVGLDVWFKGGTSLSKGFGLIERFSEDLDVKIERGTVDSVPTVASWKSVPLFGRHDFACIPGRCVAAPRRSERRF